MHEDNPVIVLSGISKMYKLFNSKQDRLKEALSPLKKAYHKDFYALRDIDLKVSKGEILGIIGMNGSGKSTLLKIISGIISPTAGDLKVTGNIVPLLELGAGFNPEFTGLENIYFYNSILGYSRAATDKMLKKILDFAEIGDFINQPLKTYSSGMKARLSFAVSVNINPDILIVDEVLSVGDELFKRKSFARIEEFFKAGKTILFVSHGIQNINELCTRAIMMVNGRIVMDGPPKDVTMMYQKYIFSHPVQQLKILDEIQKHTYEKETEIVKDPVGRGVLFESQQNEREYTKSDAYYIDNFEPKSTIITKNADIEIPDVWIENSLGEEVNCIVPGEEYLIHTKVLFLENVGQINIGIGIKTEKSVVLTWRFFPNSTSFLEKQFKMGDSLEVKWKFKCSLMPSIYYLGVTIKGHGHNGPALLFRGADIDVFKVIGSRAVDRGGYFDADFTIEIC